MDLHGIDHPPLEVALTEFVCAKLSATNVTLTSSSHCSSSLGHHHFFLHLSGFESLHCIPKWHFPVKCCAHEQLEICSRIITVQTNAQCHTHLLSFASVYVMICSDPNNTFLQWQLIETPHRNQPQNSQATNWGTLSKVGSRTSWTVGTRFPCVALRT